MCCESLGHLKIFINLGLFEIYSFVNTLITKTFLIFRPDLQTAAPNCFSNSSMGSLYHPHLQIIYSLMCFKVLTTPPTTRTPMEVREVREAKPVTMETISSSWVIEFCGNGGMLVLTGVKAMGRGTCKYQITTLLIIRLEGCRASYYHLLFSKWKHV